MTYGRWRMRRPAATRSPVRLALVGLSVMGLVFAGGMGRYAFAADTPKIPSAALVPDPASMVNTMVQTGSGGNDFPGAQAPFGMIQWSPNTKGRSAGGNYSPNDTNLRGYGLTALAGPGCGAMGDDPILPLVGTAPADVNNTMMSYDHSSEVATAGYFSAKSSGDTIQTEITTTQHAGIARITYPASTQAALLIKLRDSQNQRTKEPPFDPSSAQIVGGNEIIGNTTSGHFCGARDTYVVHFDLVFDHPFTAQVLGTGADGPDGIFVSFNTTANRVVMAKLGMSFVSDANAKANWQAEIPAFDFNAVRTATHAKWNSLLSKIEVAGGTADQRTVFYSDLYHVLNHPNVVSDVNGQYLGYDKMVHTVVSGQKAHYENFSGWDIYHNEASLAALVAPAETGDMATSLKQAFDQAGAIPQWGFMNSFNGVMIGDSAPAIVAEYHAFGARSVDDRALLADLVKQATVKNRVRGPVSDWDKFGYIPNDPSLTIEWAQEDFALSRLALALGDTADANFLLRRSNNWKNIVDPQTGLLSPRATDGTFTHVTPDDKTHGYVEGSATQYRFQVPNDQPALAKMIGGNAKTNGLLDSMFQGFDGRDPLHSFLLNEFGQGQQWFYNWTGMPSHTQEVVHRWLTTVYGNTCCSFHNNDDLGTMSAQYVWATMGIYPENLGTTDVTVNAPVFTQVLIHLANGKTITINAPQASASNFYIQSLSVNGTSQTKTWIPGSIFTNGGTVAFTLVSAPTTWGTGAGDMPPTYDAAPGPVSGPPPTTNLALNRPATGSAPCNANETPNKAVNGSVAGGLSDKFCSLAGTKFLQVDLGAPKALHSFVVRHAGAGGESTSFDTRDYDIQVSTDGTNFTTVAQVRGNTTDVTTSAVNTIGRFIRLNVLQAEQRGGTGGAARIYELEAYS